MVSYIENEPFWAESGGKFNLGKIGPIKISASNRHLLHFPRTEFYHSVNTIQLSNERNHWYELGEDSTQVK